ncbi:FtsX-like permease family protein [Candidatus Saccharibacteria bacterium]|nr:FtsX-like permease family protein [Candidatus Saccharibacteria bacterium]
MMLLKYIQIARQALKQKRDRSLITILGIVCGIAGITLLINFGLGVQRQIVNEDNSGDNLLVVRSGQAVSSSASGKITRYNFAQSSGVAPALTAGDLKAVEGVEAVEKATPVTVLNEEIKDLSGSRFHNGHVIAADADLLGLIGYEMNHGTNTLNGTKQTVVIGDEVARELFDNSRPISHEIIIGGERFIVVGVLKNPERLNPFNVGFNYRRAVIMPFAALEALNAESETETLIYEILAKTKTAVDNQIVEEVTERVLENHDQEQNFTVFRNNELVFLTGYAFDLFRDLTIIISIVFLMLGGISLTNAMQASVAERRLEIGIRKAVGATNQQIMNQFMIEALILSSVAGFLGILLALAFGLAIDYWTPIRPVIQLDVIGLMLVLSPLLGLIFGAQASAQAALQKPGDILK